ncbi:MAG: hypothetical protein MPW13_11320 [Candidatus Manganitrophus sp.]|nr:hypothetical protein [Candidatus Manganitrophus sp.]
MDRNLSRAGVVAHSARLGGGGGPRCGSPRGDDGERSIGSPAEAAPAAVEGPSETKVALDTIWVLVTAMLVFFMNLGFAMVESGFCRSKNTVNILSKNFIVFAISSLAFWVIGWGMMFGDGNGFIGTSGLFFIGGEDNSPMPGDLYKGVYSAISWATVPLLAKFFFQLVFAGTAATIVSGAVAERIKYLSFIVFSFFLVAFIYPIVGHWIWGEDGWPNSACGILPDRPWFTRSAAGRRWRAFLFWDPGLGNIKMERSMRFPAIT